MPNLADNDIIQIKTYCQLQNQLGINVLHYLVNNVVGSITEANVGAFVNTNWAPTLANLISASATYTGCSVQRVDPIPIATVYVQQSPAIVGGQAGDPLPKQTCSLITKRTALAGRRGRGRLYIPFPGETDNTVNDVPEAGYLTAVDGYAATVLVMNSVVVGANSCDITPVLWRIVLGVGLTTFITNYTVRTRWATQRRRGDFGAMNISPFL